MFKNLLLTFSIIIIIGKTSLMIAQPAIYGVTSQGGRYNLGTIYKTDRDGKNQTVLHSFGADNVGAKPLYAKLCELNGKLYGMTSEGDTSNYGVIFEYNPVDSVYKLIYSFDKVNGRNPSGSLIKAANGKLYGMTTYGGSSDFGVLFEFETVTNKFTKKVDFVGTNGKTPYGSLMEAADGKLYGMTSSGGLNSSGGLGYGGIIFQFDPATSVFTKKADIENSTNDAREPWGELAQAPNGKMYGLTFFGGLGNAGTLFEFDPITAKYTKKIDLYTVNTGYARWTKTSLTLASNGKLYGMTTAGGTGGDRGILFEYNPLDNSFSTKYNFTAASGSQPSGKLIQAKNGMLYGLTSYDGLGGGTLFEFNPVSSVFTKKFDFDGSVGNHPLGSLFEATNGKLYGLTSSGGLSLNSITNSGVLFEYNYTTNTYRKKINLNFPINGAYPDGKLVYASNGKLYGASIKAANGGMLYEFNPKNNLFKKINEFGVGGVYGGANMIEASNGKLYGYNGSGIFEFDPQTNLSVLKKAADINTGNFGGYIMEATNGNLYGFGYGASPYYGIIYEFNPYNSKFTIIYTFASVNRIDFGTAYLKLTEGKNGLLYGINKQIETFGSYGSLFKFDPTTRQLTSSYLFNSGNYLEPKGKLVELNGKLYGITTQGGLNGRGGVFEFVPETSTLTISDYFPANYLNSELGELIVGSNGKLYGTLGNVQGGGIGSFGIIYQYDPVIKKFENIHYFNKVKGAYPDGITEACLRVTQSQTNVACFGASTGSATVLAVDGLIPYTYTWKDGQSTSTSINLKAGAHSVRIKDNQGCTAQKVFLLTEPETPLIASTSNSKATCSGPCKGTATVNALGGVGPYTYAWDALAKNQTTLTATALCEGTYNVKVTDFNKCSVTRQVTLVKSDLPSVVTNMTPTTCSGPCTGLIMASASGGVPPYFYQWDSNARSQTSEVATGLCEGKYLVTVKDDFGCLGTISSPVLVKSSAFDPQVYLTNLAALDKSSISASFASYYNFSLPNAITENTSNPRNFVDPGKRVRFKVECQNNKSNGQSIVSGICKVRSNSPYITITDSSSALNNIGWNNRAWSADEFEIYIDPLTPAGTNAYIDFIVQESGKQYVTSCIAIPITPLNYTPTTDLTIDDDNNPDSKGNDNNLTQDGETVEFFPWLNNVSKLEAEYVRGQFENLDNHNFINIWNARAGVNTTVYNASWWNFGFGIPQVIPSGSKDMVPEYDFVFDVSKSTLKAYNLYLVLGGGFKLFPGNALSLIQWSLPFQFNIENVTGIVTQDGKTDDIVLFPNPTNGKFNVTLHNPEIDKDYAIHIYNSLGVPVYYNLQNSGKASIDISKFESGVYCVVFHTKAGDFIQKLIKE